MTRLGFALSSEEHPPGDLVDPAGSSSIALGGDDDVCVITMWVD